jgi:REP element-mobilizing transposase RayT
MSRRLRFIPEEGALVEVTCRALHSRLLFRPSLTLNEIILGALARAKRRYEVRVCFFVFASNHFHLLLDIDNAQQLSGFMGFFNSKLAREVGRLTDWKQKILGRRYKRSWSAPRRAPRPAGCGMGSRTVAKKILSSAPGIGPGSTVSGP